jgi:hypothetical protein
MKPGRRRGIQASMTHRVRIFLRGGDEISGRYIGEHLLPLAPRIGGHIAFEHEGRMKTGKIESIVPPNWRPDSALIPSVHVVEMRSKGGA